MATDIVLLRARNIKRWQDASFKPSALKTARDVAARLTTPKAKAVYQQLETMTGVPWFAVAMIHEREASQKWDRSIAQGDPWNKRSTHVPKGRGPFKSFIEAGVDSLVKCAPYASKWKDWTPGGMLTLQEMYNGLGYANKGRPSAYIWSGTNQYVSGKYVRDGVYDPNAVDSQLGCAVMLKAMMEADASIYPPPAAEVAHEDADSQNYDLDPADYPDPSPDHADPEDPPLVAPVAVVAAATAPATAVTATVDVPAPAVVNEELSAKSNRPVLVSTLPVDEQVREVQKQLRLKGFYSVGEADGKLGEDTKDAIMAFRRRNGLPISTDIDDELLAALATADKKPVSEARVLTTAADLAQKNVGVRSAVMNRLAGFWATIVAGVTAMFTAIASAFQSVWESETFQHIRSTLGDIPIWVWLGLAATGAGFIYWNSRRGVAADVQAHRDGQSM